MLGSRYSTAASALSFGLAIWLLVAGTFALARLLGKRTLRWLGIKRSRASVYFNQVRDHGYRRRGDRVSASRCDRSVVRQGDQGISVCAGTGGVGLHHRRRDYSVGGKTAE